MNAPVMWRPGGCPCFLWLARWWPVTDQLSTIGRFAAQVERARQLLDLR